MTHYDYLCPKVEKTTQDKEGVHMPLYCDLIAEPSVALIMYNEDKHVDKKRWPCHGPLNKKADAPISTTSVAYNYL